MQTPLQYYPIKALDHPHPNPPPSRACPELAEGGREVDFWRREVALLALLFLSPFLYFWPATCGRLLLAPGDSLAYYFPLRLLAARYVSDGHLPLWNPFIFSGFPFLAAIQSGALYPGTWFFVLFPPALAMNLLVITSYSAAATFTYAYGRAVGCTRFAAFFSALTFTFGGFMVAHLGHTSMIQGGAWLPLLLLCLERLRHSGKFRFIVGGALAVSLQILGGHPQIPAYILMVALLYVSFFALCDRPAVGRWKYVIRAGAALGSGILLAAVQILPAAELAGQSVRETLSYDAFVAYALSPLQFPMLLFPYFFGTHFLGTLYRTIYWGEWNLTELMGYVGLAPFMLAIATLPLIRRDKMVRFWLLLAFFSLLLTLGGSTPLARIMYYIPVYNAFRDLGRNLMEFDFALAILAGLGLSRLLMPPHLVPLVAQPSWLRAGWKPAPLGERGPMPNVQGKWLKLGAAVVLGLVLGVAGLALTVGEEVWGEMARQQIWGGFEKNEMLQGALSLQNPAILFPLLLGFLAAAVMVCLARWPLRSLKACLLAVHLLDLCLFGQFYEWRVLGPSPDEALREPGHMAYLRSAEPGASAFRTAFLIAEWPSQKYVSANPPNLSALWQVPAVNGYDPLMLSRYKGFARGMMGSAGQISDPAILKKPPFLDLLNVKYLVVPVPVQPLVNSWFGRIGFDPHELEVQLRAGEPLEFPLLLPQAATRIGIISFLGNSIPIADGEPVARIALLGTDGQVVEKFLLAGEHTAEWAWDRPDVATRVRHRRAQVIESFPVEGFLGHWYIGVVDVGQRMQVIKARLEYVAPEGVLNLSRLSLYDGSTDVSTPLTSLHLSLSDSSRWQRCFGAERVEVFKNLKALPRAWLVPRVLALPPEEALQIVREGKFSDGREFDPREAALIEGGPGLDFGPVDPAAQVKIIDYQPNSVELVSRSSTPAFLVLSETFYPGWKAYVDGVETKIFRTNYILRGVALQAGDHRIRFVYDPVSVKVGIGISGAVVLVFLGVGVRWRFAAIDPPLLNPPPPGGRKSRRESSPARGEEKIR